MNENNKTSKKDDRSASLPIGMCKGLAVGTAIGTATHHIGMWLPIGLSAGLCLGLVLGRKIGMNTKTIRTISGKHTTFSLRRTSKS